MLARLACVIFTPLPASSTFQMSSSNLPEPDSQLLEIGKQCSHQSCLLVDFLPFKCQHCELAFCQEHFKVEAHQCPKYDEGKHNRVAPNCIPFHRTLLFYANHLQVLCAISRSPFVPDKTQTSAWSSILVKNAP